MNLNDVASSLARIENKIDKVDVKIDKVDERQDSTDKHLAVYNEQLKVHISGVKDMRAELVPMIKLKEQSKGAVRAIGWVVTTVLAITGIWWSTL